MDLALPLLHQIATMLDTLLTSGQSDSVDLHRTPLASDDRAKLQAVLGRGELNAQVDCLGATSIRETAISGVWWVTHCDEQARVLGEFIEVTLCPEMLRCSPCELRPGLDRLRAKLSPRAPSVDPGAIADRLTAIGIPPGTNFHASSSSDQHLKRGNCDAD